MSIKESDLTTISTMEMNDFVRTVTQENSSSKVLLSAVAQVIVENYKGSLLGGSARSIKEAIDAVKTFLDSDGVVEVMSPNSFNSLPVTLYNANITDSHIVIESALTNPSAQTGEWTVTTANGSVTIDGAISGETDITLILGKKHSA